MVFATPARLSAKLGVDFLKQIVEIIAKTNGHDRVVQKLQVVDGGDGACVCEFTVGTEDLNQIGMLHGGLTATIVDNVTTYALTSKACPPGVSIDMQISYMSAAKVGDQVIVDARTVKKGKTLAYIECELRHKNDGKIIAKGGQTKYIGGSD